MIAEKAMYVGSPEHKTYPSPAGPPRPRADASRCDPAFQGRFREIETQLQLAILRQHIGAPWELGFPRYVWAQLEGVWYEARLVNSGSGQYKGYPVQRDECPPELTSK